MVFVAIEAVDELDVPVRPANLDVDLFNRPVPEAHENPFVVRRQIARPSGNPADHLLTSHGNCHLRANRVAIALRSLKLQTNPVAVLPDIILEQHWLAIQPSED